MSEIIPWTDPGGSPCCCAACTAVLPSATYASIDITPEKFSDIFNGSFYYRFELDYSLLLADGSRRTTERNHNGLGAHIMEGFRTWQVILPNGQLSRICNKSNSFSNAGLRYGSVSSGGVYTNVGIMSWERSFTVSIRDGGPGLAGTPQENPDTENPAAFLVARAATGLVNFMAPFDAVADNNGTGGDLDGSVTLFGESVSWASGWTMNPAYLAGSYARLSIEIDVVATP